MASASEDDRLSGIELIEIADDEDVPDVGGEVPNNEVNNEQNNDQNIDQNRQNSQNSQNIDQNSQTNDPNSQTNDPNSQTNDPNSQNNDDEVMEVDVVVELNEEVGAFSEANLAALLNDPTGKPEIQPGANYRIISNNRGGSSKLIVDYTNFSYLIESYVAKDGVVLEADGTERVTKKITWYLKCRHNPACKARAIVRDGVLELSKGQNGLHTCEQVAGQSQEAVIIQELLTAMKRRAGREGGSYEV